MLDDAYSSNPQCRLKDFWPDTRQRVKIELHDAPASDRPLSIDMFTRKPLVASSAPARYLALPMIVDRKDRACSDAVTGWHTRILI